jgi:hypothetical protein
MPLHISHFRWLANACIMDQSAAENLLQITITYTGCVIRRVTLLVRAHLKPGCQCSISNIAMLCSSPVRCGRLTIARPQSRKHSSIQALLSLLDKPCYVAQPSLRAPRRSNARREGWHGLVLISSTKIVRQVIVAGAAWSKVLSRLPTGPQIIAAPGQAKRSEVRLVTRTAAHIRLGVSSLTPQGS